MSYIISSFLVGTTDVVLPTYDPETPIGTAASVRSGIETASGAYDTAGAAATERQLPYDLLWRGVAAEDTITILEATLRTLHALRGKRGKLYRILASGAYEWCWARVIQVGLTERPGGLVSQEPVEVTFEVWSPWLGAAMGAGWDLDSGEYLDTGLYLDTDTLTTLDVSPKTITVTNYGNAAVTDVTITVTAGSAAITALTVKVGTTYEWTYTGTVNSGKALVVDCGAQTVKNDGVSDYANFALTASHNQAYWFALAAGANTVTVTKTGGNVDSTIEFDFWATWE